MCATKTPRFWELPACNILLQRPVRRSVISVPAEFDAAQRAATVRAAQLAGLGVLRLVNEPTAASLAYGIGLVTHPHPQSSPLLDNNNQPPVGQMRAAAGPASGQKQNGDLRYDAGAGATSRRGPSIGARGGTCPPKALGGGHWGGTADGAPGNTFYFLFKIFKKYYKIF